VPRTHHRSVRCVQIRLSPSPAHQRLDPRCPIAKVQHRGFVPMHQGHRLLPGRTIHWSHPVGPVRPHLQWQVLAQPGPTVHRRLMPVHWQHQPQPPTTAFSEANSKRRIHRAVLLLPDQQRQGLVVAEPHEARAPTPAVRQARRNLGTDLFGEFARGTWLGEGLSLLLCRHGAPQLVEIGSVVNQGADPSSNPSFTVLTGRPPRRLASHGAAETCAQHSQTLAPTTCPAILRYAYRPYTDFGQRESGRVVCVHGLARNKNAPPGPLAQPAEQRLSTTEESEGG
jgi:hypothetical protein